MFAPSNPYLSIGVILAVPGIVEALRSAPAPVVAVSPIVAGVAIRGPADQLFQTLGINAIEVRTDEPYIHPLMRFFRQRERRR